MTRNTVALGLIGIGALAYLYFHRAAPDAEQIANTGVDDYAVLANGGMPTNPTWYWGANSPLSTGDIYVNLSPDFLALTGDEYTPIFGFVGFSGYNGG